jgi:hypothetical protein
MAQTEASDIRYQKEECDGKIHPISEG